LLDGSGYIYRAYYGIRDLATSDGVPTNAVFGFTKMLLGLLRENRPDYLAVVFDRPREETFRIQGTRRTGTPCPRTWRPRFRTSGGC
jgi:ribonuclease HI